MAGRTDTVVKARYSQGRGALRLAKGHVRYAVHRTNEHGQRQYREIWDRDGRLDKLTAYERLDRVRQDDYVYRLTLSPHPERQDAGTQLDLQEWTRAIMADLERDTGRPMDWFAVVHAHTEHRHVHVVAIADRRLDVGHFRAMREAGDGNALAQHRERPRDTDRQVAATPTPTRPRDQGRDLDVPAPRGRQAASPEVPRMPSRSISRDLGRGSL